MTYFVLLMSFGFVVGFVGFSSKPSPIYGGLGLIVSGGLGCGLIMSCGGSFLGLMMFLIYLGGMLVVFGYTTAMATEEYPESWGSNAVVFGVLMLGILMEVGVMLVLLVGGGFDYLVEVGGMGDWAVSVEEFSGIFREDSVGVSSLYSYGSLLMVAAGWSLFVSIFIVIEITRGA